jgi:hypothetical protein
LKKFPVIITRNKGYIDNFYKEGIDGIRLEAIKSAQYLIDYHIIDNYIDAQSYANFINKLITTYHPDNLEVESFFSQSHSYAYTVQVTQSVRH